MLKISKNQVVPGQRVVLTNLDVAPKPDKYGYVGGDLKFAQDAFNKSGYKNGDVLTIDKVTGGNVQFHDEKGRKLDFFWSWFKQVTQIEEGSENLGKGTIEYVIYFNGKRYKTKKYGDLNKVKAAMLVMMSFHDKFYKLSRNFLDNCPELQYLSVPEWLEHGDNLSRKDFESVEIFEWSNRKLGKKSTEINPVNFYDEQMFLIKISSKFGSAARELFKKVTPEHKYMFVFMHEDYNKRYVDYESLKESEIIKKALASLKLKGTTKCTKSGKTAIAVTNATDAVRISRALPEGSRFMILDMTGNEMERRENELFVSETRNEKLDLLFS